MRSLPNTIKFICILLTIFTIPLACSLTQTVKPDATQAGKTDAPEIPTVIPETTEAPPEPVSLDPCALLTDPEAEKVIGGPVTAPQVRGNACTYSDAATGVYVVSAYALQEEERKGLFSGRIFLLTVFDLKIEQPAIDEIIALDNAGEHKTALEKLSAIAVTTTAFSAKVVDGLGDASLWVWKDLGGTRQAFMIVVRGNVTAGIDLVVGSTTEEPAALRSAREIAEQIFNRVPEVFTIARPEATATPTVPPLPTETPTSPPPAETQTGGGGLIAFASDRAGGSDIYVMNVDGSGQRRLTYSGSAHTPMWSPDGSLLAFLSIDDQGVGLYTIKPDGSIKTLVTRPAYIAGAPTWSPDGTRLAYTVMDNGNTDIYAVNLDGSGLVRLTSDPAADMEPAWSPDGSKIAFVSQRSGTLQLFLMNPDGSEQTPLTNFSGLCSEPAWSPDSSRLVAICTSQGSWGQVYILNADGSGMINVSNNDLDNHAPAWSPDGTKIIFYAAGFQGHWQIFSMNTDGSGQKNLINSTTNDSFPSWQP